MPTQEPTTRHPDFYKVRQPMPAPLPTQERVSTCALFEILKEHIHACNVANGFWEGGPEARNKGEAIALMHSELSEGLEAIRKNLISDHIPYHGIEEELADVLIRIFDFAAGFDILLAEAMLAKLDFNRQRAYKHGKSF